MRSPVMNRYSYVTCEFAYVGKTGYMKMYTGQNIERQWKGAYSIPNCKTREEAELRAIEYMIVGDPRKDTMAELGVEVYGGFDRNARVQLVGFDAIEKAVLKLRKDQENKKKNMEKLMKNRGWNAFFNYFGKGLNGLKFDLIRINNTLSDVIPKVETYVWTSLNREANAATFKAMVSNAAKAQRAAQAKAETPKVEAKASPAPKAVVA